MLLTFIKIALLNTLRNKRRTITTLLSIIFGVTSIIIFGGYFVGLYDGLRESMIRSEIGHLQIYKKGYKEFGTAEPEKYLLSKQEVEKIDSIIDEIESVEIHTHRLHFSGLISNSNNSFGILATGGLSDNEGILNSFLRVDKGELLSEDDTEGALLGTILAKNLNAKIGDYFTIMGATSDGAINAIDIKVSGIVKSGFKEMDSRYVQVNLPLAQSFKDSEQISSVVVLLENTVDTQATQNIITKKAKELGLEIEILRWDEISDIYHKITGLFDTIYQFIYIIVIVIVMFSVSNTVSMSIMERVSEIGTMRALGTTKPQIVLLFMLESVFIGLIGCLLGMLVGWITSEWINLLQIKQPPPPTRNEEYIVRIMFDLETYTQTIIIVLISGVSGILASMRGIQFKIVDALRHV